MKMILSLLVMVVGFQAFAEESLEVDCSKAAAGKVSIKSVNQRISNSQALEKAYKCLVARGGNETVRRAKAAAIVAARDDAGDGSRRQCARSNEDLQIVELASWSSDRPSPKSEELYETGRNGMYLVRQPITCSGIGTGLFGGIVSSVSLKMSISENYVFSMEKEEIDSVQTITIELKQAITL